MCITDRAGQIASGGIPIFATCAVFFALNIAYIGYYQSIGKALRAMVYTLLRGAILLVPMFFVMPRLFPAWGMWGAIPASELVTLCIILLCSVTTRARKHSCRAQR